MGLEMGFPRALAVDEQKMKPGGTALGDFMARCRRLLRPVMWSFSKLCRRMLKFTAQAAWTIKVVFFTSDV